MPLDTPPPLHHATNSPTSNPSTRITKTHTPSRASLDENHQSNHTHTVAGGKGKARAQDAILKPEWNHTYNEPFDREEGEGEEWCLICHSSGVWDRTVLPICLHSQFCFGCILRWSNMKPTCPLCLAKIGEFVIHDIRSDWDYIRYYLAPPRLPSCSTCTPPSDPSWATTRQRARQSRIATHADQEQILQFRKYIYRHSLYAKHVGSNAHTGYKPPPSPLQIKSNLSEWSRKITTFVRRELQLWPNVDAEFLAQYLVSLAQLFELASEEMANLLGEFVGGEEKGRHFAHELACWLRSRRERLEDYDNGPWLQYGTSTSDGSTRRKRRRIQEKEEEKEQGSREQVAQRRSRLLDRLERERALLFCK
ncbi:uncharacterized protein UBRO_20376 [Ustilago bromivora]|uniref:RING-type E3 ubiquitin transferase n=1 Tax=Ustilago bromivora TaxID=307758 RepID=A0A1K0G6I0_9BASI|nr:uncharacterized protein UBRO_20376 [Ustilago bromivora]